MPVRPGGERAGDPPLREGRHAARARLPERVALRRLVLARHAESEYSLKQLVNGDPGVACPLTAAGREQARALGAALADEPLDVVAVTEFERVRETAELAVGERRLPVLVVPELNDPWYGDFEGGSLAAYREWAWGRGPLDAPPSSTKQGGEHRGDLAARYAAGFRIVLERPEDAILVVAHSLPLRYVLDAAEGRPPAAKVGMVEYATPYRLARAELEAALDVLEAWAAAPSF